MNLTRNATWRHAPLPQTHARYSEGRMEEPELGEVEEHLLICEYCRRRLTGFDDAWGLNG